MTINNFEQISKLLKFENDNDFYFIQILKRRKDNPEMERHIKVIKSFYVYSFSDLNDISNIIIELCDNNNARAYIRLNRRNSKTISIEILKYFVGLLNGELDSFDKNINSVTDIANLLSSSNFNGIKDYIYSLGLYKIYDSICGSSHSNKDKTWIVDIDFKDGELPHDIESLHKLLYDLQKLTKKEPIMEKIPTKNGYHLVTRPFNLKEFGDSYPNIDIHKDNPTILYY